MGVVVVVLVTVVIVAVVDAVVLVAVVVWPPVHPQIPAKKSKIKVNILLHQSISRSGEFTNKRSTSCSSLCQCGHQQPASDTGKMYPLGHTKR